LISVDQAWQLLHHDHPRLSPEATSNYRGKLRPGQVITAEVVRTHAEIPVDFEIIRKGHIKFTHEIIPNMATWPEIHAHFRTYDKRILPHDLYIDEETRPYFDNTLSEFSLKDSSNTQDTSGEDGAVAVARNLKDRSSNQLSSRKSSTQQGEPKFVEL
jgi:hypothetical protein